MESADLETWPGHPTGKGPGARFPKASTRTRRAAPECHPAVTVVPGAYDPHGPRPGTARGQRWRLANPATAGRGGPGRVAGGRTGVSEKLKI